MKITDVQTIVVNAKLRNWVFVKVLTSEPGLVGWGEATLEWKTRAVCGAVDDLAPLLIGQDPTRITHLWNSMYRHPFFKGGVVTMSAISGIDIALWDLNGKLLGQPVWRLLGGRVRDRLRMYDHLGGGDSSAVYGAADPDHLAAMASASVADGFTALKFLPIPPGAALASQRDIRGSRSAVVAVREAIGDDVELMLDFHGRTSVGGAIAFAAAVAEYGIWFVEEPVQPEDPTAVAEVARAIQIPVAGGERLTSPGEFRRLFELRAVAVAQPDICHVGGFTGIAKVAALAETFQVPLAPHNPLGPIATWANIQFAFATPNLLVQEVMRRDVPWRAEVITDVPIVDGHAGPPAAPGLGCEPDETACARYPYSPEPQYFTSLTDGSVGDW